MNASLLWTALDRWPEELIARKFRLRRQRLLRYCAVGWLHEVAVAAGEPCRCRGLPLPVFKAAGIEATVRCVAAAYDLDYEDVHRLMRKNDHLEMWDGDRDRSARMRRAVRSLLGRRSGDVLEEAGAVVLQTGLMEEGVADTTAGR